MAKHKHTLKKHNSILVGLFNPFENISEMGLLFPIYMEKYIMFQTTNQHHTVKPSTRHFTKPRLQEMS